MYIYTHSNVYKTHFYYSIIYIFEFYYRLYLYISQFKTLNKRYKIMLFYKMSIKIQSVMYCSVSNLLDNVIDRYKNII
jgi:hypothetical protein